jgi:hypothetical protein
VLDSFTGTDLYSDNALGEFLPFFRAIITILDPEPKIELPESVIDWEFKTRIAHELDEDMGVIHELNALAFTDAIEPSDDDSTVAVAQVEQCGGVSVPVSDSACLSSPRHEACTV